MERDRNGKRKINRRAKFYYPALQKRALIANALPRSFFGGDFEKKGANAEQDGSKKRYEKAPKPPHRRMQMFAFFARNGKNRSDFYASSRIGGN